MDVISLIVMLFVLLLLSNIGSYTAKRLQLPGMIGEIVFGIIAANLVLIHLGGWNLLDQIGIIVETPTVEGSEGYNVLMLFAELGIVFLLFTVGLETRVKDLFKVGKPAVYAAVLGIIFPFIAGFALKIFFDGDIMASLFIGTALMTTSAGIAAHILKQLDLANSKEGKIILGAAVISEIVTLIVLAVLSGLSGGDTTTMGITFTVFKAVFFVFAAIFVCIYVMPPVHRWLNRNVRNGNSAWTMLFVGIGACLILAITADAMGLSAIIGSYFAGMMFADRAEEWNMITEVEPLREFFMTFFFISVGIRIVLADLNSFEIVLFAVLLTILAIASKYLACGIGAKLGDPELDNVSSNIIGWGMVPKAEVVMVIATLGVMSGALKPVIFSCIVITSIVTTAVSHFMVEKKFRDKYGEDLSVACEK